MALIDNLVSYWKLDEVSGTREDIHGVNDLTDNNTVTSTTGKINLAADFEKDSSEYLSITDGSQVGLDITDDLSISLWMKKESSTAAQYPALIQKWGVPTLRQYTIDLYDTENQISFGISSDGTTLTSSEKSFDPTDGQWYHIALVYDASAGSAEFFIDSVSQTAATGLANSIANVGGLFNLGSNQQVFFYDGLIDECGIWSRTLTSAEVVQLYNGGAGLAYPFGSKLLNLMGVGT